MRVQRLVAINLRRLRVGQGVSQEALAVDAALARGYVSRLERSLENPSVAVLERLAKALGADMRELFNKEAAARGPVKPLPNGRKRKNL